jgi:hypothetical protein
MLGQLSRPQHAAALSEARAKLERAKRIELSLLAWKAITPQDDTRFDLQCSLG